MAYANKCAWLAEWHLRNIYLEAIENLSSSLILIYLISPIH